MSNYPGNVYSQPPAYAAPMQAYPQYPVNTPYAHPPPVAAAQPPMAFQMSSCQGNRKALLVGINYKGQRNELRGCINDVNNVRRFITSRYRFPDDPNHLIALTDDQVNPQYRPTRQNMIHAIQWLVGGARAGDSLFFHFSGHGGLVRDQSGDEKDGYDSCLYPLDHQQTSPILDDELHALMVKHLPPGVRLTVILDCCHNGSGLDLPYEYNSDGSLKRFRPEKQLLSTLTSVGMNLMGGRTVGALTSAVQGLQSLMNPGRGQQAEQVAQQTRTSMAEVISFSGSKDSQTSADTVVHGVGATGAMSYAFMKALTEQPQQSYLSLLAHVRGILQREYSQKPQLSSGYPMDMNAPFLM